MIEIDFNDYFIYRDGKLYAQPHHRPQGMTPGKPVGGVDSQGYLSVTLKYKLYKIHRIIWEMHNGPLKKGQRVYHANGKREDNRIENLTLTPFRYYE